MTKKVFSIFTCLALGTTLMAQIPTSGLVSRWDFNNGNANDAVGIDHAMVYGATLTADRWGNAGKAYYFDGINDELLMGGYHLGTGDFAVSLWYQVSATMSGGAKSLINKLDGTNTGFSVGIEKSGSSVRNSFYLRGTSGNVRSATTQYMPSENWWNVVLNHSAGITNIYINGVSVGSSSSPLSGSPSNVAGMDVGVSGSVYYRGAIDDILLYDRVLAPSEITAIYNAPNPVTVCTVNIPDPAFKAYLVGNSAINLNGNTEIECSEAQDYTEEIYCHNLGIADLTGIEAFTSLTRLYCDHNQLTSLDISNNTDLTTLQCNNNLLTSLNVSNNTSLTGLYFHNNLLTSSDLSSHTALTRLYCYNNQLTSLNIANGNNINFTAMRAEGNPNLTCIQVDDVAHSTANWTGSSFTKPVGTIWSENCSLGINEVWNAKLIEVYPNPASTVLNVVSPEATSIKIINVLGATVSTHNLTTGTNSIDVSNLTKGVYFLQTDKGGAVKFIKD